MSDNISSERHLSKDLFFFLIAKITFSARFEENFVYIAKVTGEISNFVCFLYFDDHAPQPRHEYRRRNCGLSLQPIKLQTCYDDTLMNTGPLRGSDLVF